MALLGRRPRVNLLRIVWALVFLWFEYGILLFDSCDWPDAALRTSSPTQPTAQTTGHNTTHILLVADPHVLHSRCSFPDRFALFAHLAKFITHLNLSKHWHVALRKRPDAVVFLGDMLDCGRDRLSHDDYELYHSRFRSIFSLDRDIPVHFVPGSRDVGLGTYPYLAAKARSRYTSHFGAPNYHVSVANHTLVFFDAPNYSDEEGQRHGLRLDFDQWKPMIGGSVEYMVKFGRLNVSEPVIFFSHIPFHRPDGKKCGPLRETGTLRPGVGKGWQSTLEKQASLRLLENFKPAIIFSGNSHDYCDYTHNYPHHVPPLTVGEITTKTLSTHFQIQRPAFHLLSLAPAEERSEGKPTFSDRLCLLPNRDKIYKHLYLPLSFFTFLLITITNAATKTRTTASAHHHRHQPDPSPSSSSPPSQHALRTLESPTDSSSDDESSFMLPFQTRPNSNSVEKPTIAPGWRLVTEDPSVLSAVRSVVTNFASLQSPSRRRRWILGCGRDLRDVTIVAGAVLFVTCLLSP